MTSIPFVDLKAQYHSIQAEIDRAIAETLRNATFIGGASVHAFEEAFAAYIGVTECIGVANGTDAIEIALQALGVGPGDEVLVPANTWISTSESVTTVGARPVFVDNHPTWYTMDVSKIEAKITERTKAIIPVHLYGLPAEMDEILAIAKRHNLLVIEDCAQAHGATYKGQKIGMFGQAATFSFFPGKNLGAYGDAGGIVTPDPELAKRMRMIANHGRLGKFDHSMEGRNSRLDSLQAAILSVKLPYLEQWTEARRQNAAYYNRYLADLNIQKPVAPEYSRHVYHLYVVQVPERDAVRGELDAQGVQTGIHYPIALPYTQAYRYMNHSVSDYPVAHAGMSRILSLPMYAELTEPMIQSVCEKLAQAVSARPVSASGV